MSGNSKSFNNPNSPSDPNNSGDLNNPSGSNSLRRPICWLSQRISSIT